MDDERVDRWLRALPREVASPGFTARVLARLDEADKVARKAGTERAARIFGLPRLTLPAVVLAATLAVAASLSLQGGGTLPSPEGLAPRAPTARQPTSAPPSTLGSISGTIRGTIRTPQMTLASTGRTSNGLAARHARALLQEIRSDQLRLHDELRRRERQSSKVYLGGDEDMDLVVHLDQVRELPSRQDPPPYQYD